MCPIINIKCRRVVELSRDRWAHWIWCAIESHLAMMKRDTVELNCIMGKIPFNLRLS